MWIEINENRLLVFRQHEIFPPTARNLCLEDPRMINRFNYTLHTRFLKHYIYQKIHFIHVQDSYPLPTHIAQAFEIVDELITRLMHTADKKCRSKIIG